MTWNYRVVAERGPFDEADWYSVREVYYGDDGAVQGVTGADEVGAGGSSVAELREDLRHYAEALERPVLRWPDDFPDPE